MLNYIIWNPDGTLLDLGFYQLRWYSVLFGLGFVLGYQFVKWRFKRAEIDAKLLDNLAVYLVLGTIIGARLAHCIFYDWDYYSNHLLEIFLPFRFSPEFEFIGFQGLASHGGGLGVIVALLLFSRRYTIQKLWLIDTISVAIPLAAVCIRLGNLMNSEIVGKTTDLPWAFIFERVGPQPRHPAQLYEAIAYLLLFIMLFVIDRSTRVKEGFLFGLMLTGMFVARFFLEFLKADQTDFEAGMLLNMGQVLSIPYIIVGLVFIYWGTKETRGSIS